METDKNMSDTPVKKPEHSAQYLKKEKRQVSLWEGREDPNMIKTVLDKEN